MKTNANVKTVNMLPAWYRKELQQRGRLRWHAALMISLGAVMLVWAQIAHLQILSQRDELARLDRQASVVSSLAPAIEATRADLARLDNLQLAYRELGNTVPMSSVIQQIQNDMTAGMSLSRLAIDVRNEAVKGTGFVGDTKNPPRYRDLAHLTVVGVAPSDTQIAQLIGKLSLNPLFNDVSLNFMHKEILRDYQVRRFEIQMTMDLTRLAVETPGSNQAEGAAPAATVPAEDKP